MPGIPDPDGPIAPIFTSVKQAAKAIDVSPWVMYQLLNERKIESRYHGRSRKVVVASLLAYADSLPTERPESESA